MWTIVGLGNPGIKYSKTRHNVGFRVIEQLSQIYNINLVERDLYSIGKGMIEGEKVILLKPLAFMNRSGTAVKKVMKKNNLLPADGPCNLIVIQDDLDIETGTIKIRRDGSSGGHKGIESIIQELGTKEFIRVKLGIGRDKDIPTEKYVLCNFKPAEKKLVEDSITNSGKAVALIITEGTEKAMNSFNRAVKSPPSGQENI